MVYILNKQMYFPSSGLKTIYLPKIFKFIYLDTYRNIDIKRRMNRKSSDFFDRIDKYMKYKGLNDNKITIQAGISNGLIGKGRKRGSLSLGIIEKILYTYPDLNANWLITGKGDMINNEANISSIISITQAFIEDLRRSIYEADNANASDTDRAFSEKKESIK